MGVCRLGAQKMSGTRGRWTSSISPSPLLWMNQQVTSAPWRGSFLVVFLQAPEGETCQLGSPFDPAGLCLPGSPPDPCDTWKKTWANGREGQGQRCWGKAHPPGDQAAVLHHHCGACLCGSEPVEVGHFIIGLGGKNCPGKAEGRRPWLPVVSCCFVLTRCSLEI